MRRVPFGVVALILGACLDFGNLNGTEAPLGTDGGRVDGAAAADGAVVINGDGGSATEAGDATSSPIDATTDAIGESDASSVVATVYSYFEQTGVWGTPIPLDQFWGVSPNAPPARGIASVLQISVFDRLIVFTDNGMVYRRAAGVWMPSQPIAAVFSTLVGVVPTSTYHVRDGTGGATKVGITALKNPTAYLFDYSSSDVVTVGAVVPLNDEPGNGAPQKTGTSEWDFEIFDLTKYGVDASWSQFYVSYGSDVYRLDGAGGWTKWQKAKFPYFLGKAGAPIAKNIRAAFYSGVPRVLYMIGD